MKKKNIFPRAVAVRLLVPSLASLWSFVALGAFVLPHAKTSEEKAALSAELAGLPWVGNYAGTIPGIVAGTEKLVPLLEADPLWQKLAAERGDPVNVNVDVMGMEQRQIRAPKREIADQWRREISESIATAEREHPNAPLLGSLVQKITAEVRWLSGHDAGAILTGAVNSLPGPERGPYFKIPSVEEKLKALRGNANFNDHALKASFRGDAFGITPDQISRQFIEEMLDESIRRDAALSPLLRATWYAERITPEQLAALARDPGAQLAQAPDTSLDPFNTPLNTEDAKDFFDKLAREAAHGADNPNQALTKRINPYLQRLIKSQINEGNYEERMENVPVVSRTYRVQEVPAALGATRGMLMQDCSTTAYGFAYSPQEYVYLVSDPKGAPTGFIAATAVDGGGLRTLFIHDFGGQGVTAEMASYVLEGFSQALPQLGFAQLTVAAMNGNNGQYRTAVNALKTRPSRIAQQVYPDSPLRTVIKAQTGYTYLYDMPTNGSNVSAMIYDSVPEIALNLRVRVEGGAPGGVVVDMPKSKPDAILRAIELYNANPEAGVTAEMLKIDGVQTADLQKLFFILKNTQALPLEKYYGSLQEAFGKFEINLSRNFVRDRAALFWEGHLRAADATTSADLPLVNRTVEYAIMSMKRLPNPEAALALLNKDREFFLRSDKFQAYLRSFTGQGANEAPQIQKLMAIGYDFDFLKQNGETMLRLANGTEPLVRRWAIRQLQPEQLPHLAPEAVRLIAADLEADDDNIPVAASKLLLHTNNRDPKVIHELKVTVNEEEDGAIATRAAIALIEVGEFGTGSVRRLRQNIRNRNLEATTRARALRLLKQLKNSKDARYCDAMLEADNEEPDDA